MAPRFEGFEGQMARDISKMTFKKLIQFRKSIFFFAMLRVICPLTFPGLENYEVCVSQTPKIFGYRSPKFEHVWRIGRQICFSPARQPPKKPNFWPMAAGLSGVRRSLASRGVVWRRAAWRGVVRVWDGTPTTRLSQDDAR